MERWQRELDRLGDVTAPQTTRAHVDDGPHGDGMPPSPTRGQRIAAGVVAFVVFGAVLSLLLRAGGGAEPEPVDQGPRWIVTLTFLANGGGPTGTMAIAGRTFDGNGSSFSWDDGNSHSIADTFGSEFEFERWFEIPAGASIDIAGDAEAVKGAVDSCCDPQGFPQQIAPIDLSTDDAVTPVEPGRYVLEFTATWPQGRRTFYFPVDVVVSEATPSIPDPSTAAPPIESPAPGLAPEADQAIEGVLTGSSWALAKIDDVMLDIEEPPTAIFSTARLVGFSGCNGYGTEDWRVRDGRLVTGEIVQTLILCPGSLEGTFTGILAGEPVVSFDGTKLGLSSDEGTMVFDRIDLDQPDVVGSFLDCWSAGRVDVRPSGNAILEPAPPSYFTVNLPWIERSDDLVRIAGSPELDQPSRWAVVRDGLVVAEVDYPDLTGIACPGSGA